LVLSSGILLLLTPAATNCDPRDAIYLQFVGDKVATKNAFRKQRG
jgi:hypothetical protein